MTKSDFKIFLSGFSRDSPAYFRQFVLGIIFSALSLILAIAALIINIYFYLFKP